MEQSVVTSSKSMGEPRNWAQNKCSDADLTYPQAAVEFDGHTYHYTCGRLSCSDILKRPASSSSILYAHKKRSESRRYTGLALCSPLPLRMSLASTSCCCRNLNQTASQTSSPQPYIRLKRSSFVCSRYVSHLESPAVLSPSFIKGGQAKGAMAFLMLMKRKCASLRQMLSRFAVSRYCLYCCSNGIYWQYADAGTKSTCCG